MLSRSRRILLPLGALVLSAGAASAQMTVRAADCRGMVAGMRINSAKVYLGTAMEKRRTDPVLFQSKLRSAQTQLDTALLQGREDPMTVAFLLGQARILGGDLAGADSMFSRAEASASDDCKRVMAQLRRSEWINYFNGALAQRRAGNVDSALALLRRGSLIWRGEPAGFLEMASHFARRNQTDSAIIYALRAARSSEEPRFAELRKGAWFTAAQLLQGANRHAEAESAFREYLRLAPRNLAGMAGLGATLTAQNKTAEATALFDTLSTAADTASDPDELFDSATQMLLARRYALAARIYERELTINRCHRDGLYNLASTYNSMRDSVHMLPIARRLVEVDPMNRGSLAMLAQAYVLLRDTMSIGTLQRLQALPWSFELIRFAPAAGDTSVTVQGAVSNVQDRPLPAFRLTMEFLNRACEPVSQTVVEVPQIDPNGSQTVDVTGRGRGIAAYRYKTN